VAAVIECQALTKRYRGTTALGGHDFWSRFIGAGASLGQLPGLLGLAALLAVCCTGAAALFGRQDISG
jgi:hypothetical protein